MCNTHPDFVRGNYGENYEYYHGILTADKYLRQKFTKNYNKALSAMAYKNSFGTKVTHQCCRKEVSC